MFETSVVFQDGQAGAVSVLAKALTRVARDTQWTRLRVAVAYASVSGCRDLVTRLSRSMPGWNAVTKRWLISIDFGRTEVEALRYLNSLQNSEVRIPNAAELLESNLLPQCCFHPKTFIFDRGREDQTPLGIFLGSGNLTLSGLHTGVEHGSSMIWADPLSESEQATLADIEAKLSWWEGAWRDATPATEAILRQYERIRPIYPRDDSSTAARPFAESGAKEIDVIPGTAWSTARCLWVQTHELYKNRGKQQPGNQLDLRRGTRVFFGFSSRTVARNTVFGQITLQYNNMDPSSRSVRFGNNSMDKVNLPIPGIEGPANYDNTIVHFERIGSRKFLVSLGNATDLGAWLQLSQAQGTLYELAGGRQFGFYN